MGSDFQVNKIGITTNNAKPLEGLPTSEQPVHDLQSAFHKFSNLPEIIMSSTKALLSGLALGTAMSLIIVPETIGEIAGKYSAKFSHGFNVGSKITREKIESDAKAKGENIDKSGPPAAHRMPNGTPLKPNNKITHV